MLIVAGAAAAPVWAWPRNKVLRQPTSTITAPGRIPEGGVTSQFAYATDVLPTVLEIAGIALPGDEYRGRKVHRPTGTSLLPHGVERLLPSLLEVLLGPAGEVARLGRGVAVAAAMYSRTSRVCSSGGRTQPAGEYLVTLEIDGRKFVKTARVLAPPK